MWQISARYLSYEKVVGSTYGGNEMKNYSTTYVFLENYALQISIFFFLNIKYQETALER